MSAFHALFDRELNSLRRQVIVPSYRILHTIVQRLSQHSRIICTIAIFKSIVKENNYLNKTYRYVRNISLYRTSYVVPKNRIWILTFNRPLHSYFFYESGLIKSCSFFKCLSAYAMSWPPFVWCKFLSHFRSLKFLHFRNAEAAGLKVWHRGQLLAWLLTDLHKNLLNGSKVVWRAQRADRQNGDIISWISYLRKVK
jgi:hypothetical protein